MNRRTTKTVQRAMKSADQEVRIDDIIDEELERKYMQLILDIISGKINTIGEDESTALIALTKEYKRRNLEIIDLVKQMEKIDYKL